MSGGPPEERGADAGPEARAEEPERAEPPRPTGPSSNPAGRSEREEGTWPPEIPPLELVADAEAARLYAELSADHNPIHLDAAFARGAGFDGPIAHGTLSLGLLLRAVEAAFGAPPASLDIRFTRPLPVGATVRVGGRHEGKGRYAVWAEAVGGARTLEGTATLGDTP